jgi:hypothetical protein
MRRHQGVIVVSGTPLSTRLDVLDSVSVAGMGLSKSQLLAISRRRSKDFPPELKLMNANQTLNIEK